MLTHLLQTLLFVGLAVGGGVLGSLWVNKHHAPASPTVAIVDFNRLAVAVNGRLDGGLNDESMMTLADKTAEQMQARVQALKEAGFVVLDASAVVAASEEHYVTLDDGKVED
ncbi:MAG: hypothetical protein ACR2RB_03665 [Gammaproteobacteria bacterium]